ncbi:MAG: PaaI family thioesterase [Myxococcales bacterium]|nr:PaaI family thioesterase [Myxococcales bacterium]
MDARIQAIWAEAGFMTALGTRLDAVGDGWVEASVVPTAAHTQQDGFVHAAVITALADHAAGAAAATRAGEGHRVLTQTFTMHLLRPAVGERVRVRATVLRSGRTSAVVESEVFARKGDEEQLVAKGTFTIAVVAPRADGGAGSPRAPHDGGRSAPRRG